MSEGNSRTGRSLPLSFRLFLRTRVDGGRNAPLSRPEALVLLACSQELIVRAGRVSVIDALFPSLAVDMLDTADKVRELPED